MRVRAIAVPAIAVGRPLCQESCVVLAHERAGVDAAAQECATPKVMHEAVAGDHRPKPRRNRPQTVIIILKAPDPELFIEQPDRVDQFAA